VLAILAKDGKKLIPKWTPPATAEARVAKIEWTKVEGDNHVHFEGGCGGSTEL
jgi:hypothetical protein